MVWFFYHVLPSHSEQKRRAPAVHRSHIAGPLTAAGDGPEKGNTSPAPRHRSGLVFYGLIHLFLRRITVELRNLCCEICDFASQEEFPDDVCRDGSTEFF